MCIRQNEQVVSFDLIGPEAGNMGREDVEWDVGRLTRVKESARKLILLREILVEIHTDLILPILCRDGVGGFSDTAR